MKVSALQDPYEQLRLLYMASTFECLIRLILSILGNKIDVISVISKVEQIRD